VASLVTKWKIKMLPVDLAKCSTRLSLTWLWCPFSLATQECTSSPWFLSSMA